ncbi:MAG: hypothetical protein JWM59_4422 [Verrucomicrobiales bacterium]|nr:hypothetical protein [Verrucomicrobiales bacterium]
MVLLSAAPALPSAADTPAPGASPNTFQDTGSNVPPAAGITLEPGTATGLGGGRTAVLKKTDTLPYVESGYTRRYRFDSFENPKLTELRERHALSEVVADGRDEFEKQVLLMDWTHNRFTKFGPPSMKCRGALNILQAVAEGHTFFCQQYSEVLVSAAASLGWISRPLALRRHQGVAKEGGSTEHSVTEIWSNQHRKWVMLDPTLNLYLERDGVPLNAWEIRGEWFHRGGANLVFVIGKEKAKYTKADLPVLVGRFAGFGDLSLHPDELDKYGFIGYIPNTDLMDAGYDYENMFITRDRLCEGTPWHRRTLPEHPGEDPYFPVGQSAMTLEAGEERIHVALKTLTPNFARYEARTEGSAWRPCAEKFVWPVHPGLNRLEVRTVNRFEVTGPLSMAEIEVKEK